MQKPVPERLIGVEGAGTRNVVTLMAWCPYQAPGGELVGPAPIVTVIATALTRVVGEYCHWGGRARRAHEKCVQLCPAQAKPQGTVGRKLPFDGWSHVYSMGRLVTR